MLFWLFLRGFILGKILQYFIYYLSIVFLLDSFKIFCILGRGHSPNHVALALLDTNLRLVGPLPINLYLDPFFRGANALYLRYYPSASLFASFLRSFIPFHFIHSHSNAHTCARPIAGRSLIQIQLNDYSGQWGFDESIPHVLD